MYEPDHLCSLTVRETLTILLTSLSLSHLSSCVITELTFFFILLLGPKSYINSTNSNM